MAILRLIRFPNLAIVALTQYLLEYIVIAPAFRAYGIERSLDGFHFFLLVITTICIAAGGYIINDILDYQMDMINRPGKVVIDKSISRRSAFTLFHLFTFSGFGIALYLAQHVGNIPLVLIYPGAIWLLFVYSKYLKKEAFWGNFVIAVFCASVAGIVLFAERKGFVSLPPDSFQFVKIIFIAYLVFAFLSTIYREIIKDIEDFKGDQTYGCNTLAVKYGVQFAKSIAFCFGGILLAGIIWWMFFQITYFNSTKLLFLVFALNFMAVIVSLLLLTKARSKKEFSRLSLVAKYIMVSGLIYLFFLK